MLKAKPFPAICASRTIFLATMLNVEARVLFRLNVTGENAVRATIEFANVTETAVDLHEVVIADKAQDIEIEDPEKDKTIETELEEIKEVISTRATELWRSAQQWFSTSRSLLKESYAAKKVAMGPVLQTVSEHALQLKEDTAARASTFVTSLKQGAATRTLSDVTNQLVAQTQILSASATPAAQKAKANAAAVADKMKASAGVLASSSTAATLPERLARGTRRWATTPRRQMARSPATAPRCCSGKSPRKRLIA